MWNFLLELIFTTFNRQTLQEVSAPFKLVSDVIAKITGYQLESISLEDRFQEDLGIDSIKKTEILFTVMDRLNYRPEGEVDYSQFERVSGLFSYLERETAMIF